LGFSAGRVGRGGGSSMANVDCESSAVAELLPPFSQPIQAGGGDLAPWWGVAVARCAVVVGPPQAAPAPPAVSAARSAFVARFPRGVANVDCVSSAVARRGAWLRAWGWSAWCRRPSPRLVVVARRVLVAGGGVRWGGRPKAPRARLFPLQLLRQEARVRAQDASAGDAPLRWHSAVHRPPPAAAPWQPMSTMVRERRGPLPTVSAALSDAPRRVWHSAWPWWPVLAWRATSQQGRVMMGS